MSEFKSDVGFAYGDDGTVAWCAEMVERLCVIAGKEPVMGLVTVDQNSEMVCKRYLQDVAIQNLAKKAIDELSSAYRHAKYMQTEASFIECTIKELAR